MCDQWRKSLSFWVSIFLLFSISVAFAQSQPPSPTATINSAEQKKHPATTDEKPAYNPTGTDTNPIVIKSLEAEKTPERTEQERPEREEKSANERSLIAWTIVLAIATIVMAGVAGGQLYMFRRQLRLIRASLTDTKNAADAANKSADAAERTVKIMQDTAQRQMRAYICFQEGHVDLHANEGFYDVTIHLKNSGNTPAYDVQTWRSSQIIDQPEPPAAFDAPQSWGGRGMVGPGAYMGASGTLRHPFTPDDRASIKSGRKMIFVWGEVIYRDAFGERRFTRFRHVLGSETGRGWFLRPAEHGNEAN